MDCDTRPGHLMGMAGLFHSNPRAKPALGLLQFIAAFRTELAHFSGKTSGIHSARPRKSGG